MKSIIIIKNMTNVTSWARSFIFLILECAYLGPLNLVPGKW